MIIMRSAIINVMESNSYRLPKRFKLILTLLVISVVVLFVLVGRNFATSVSAIDANAVSVRQNSGNVQWKLPGGDWQTLVTVAELTKNATAVNGRDGSDGRNGTNGASGKNGADGQAGANGASGTNGANGENGTDGAPGQQGPAGTNGTNGVDGKDGTNGTNGADGPQGQAGTNGANGVDGKDGVNGANGTNGTNGTNGREIELQKGTLYIQWRYVGDATWNNIIAYSDLKGDKGDKGDTGSAGTNGTNGAQGIQGTQGIQGLQGPAGADGIGNSIAPINVATATPASTVAKIGTTTGGAYIPTAGSMILLTLTTANTASNPTLNVDGSGAKNILIGNMAPSSIAMAGTKVLLWYDGTAYQLFGSQRASDSSTTYTGITGATTTATTATAALSIDRFTIANYTAGKLMFTLPASAAVGSVVEVYAASSGGYRITAGASASILYPDGVSSGAAGWIESSQYGTIRLRCVVANTTWVVASNSKLITNNNGATYN